jgi:hypothetical protein
VIEGTSLTYDGVKLDSSNTKTTTSIYFEVGKCPAEKKRFTYWQPHSRGIFIKAKTTGAFKTLNDSGVKMYSKTPKGL